jgi:hypothetical protein
VGANGQSEPNVVRAHSDLHSELGARRGEHLGRSPNPVIKVHDGDVVEATVATDDRIIDLGAQRNVVRCG